MGGKLNPQCVIFNRYSMNWYLFLKRILSIQNGFNFSKPILKGVKTTRLLVLYQIDLFGVDTFMLTNY